ncbi:MAG: hypothetical protein COY68_00980 [Candidatus Levybacteria bacterium CG_4_10_14_0_8_um_filter_35_23]|nr:MAG: hypothetical protein COY68_00980 [Candidatus Levybacteria bacterium CG_4_10_14_0_8_um_filter_35_23]
MDKSEVVSQLKNLASELKTRKYLTLDDLRKIPRLEYYMQFHYRGLANALKAANLPSSKLAAAMRITNEELLDYLRNLKTKLKRNPKVWDFTDDKDLYKKYSDYKISWSIYKTRFGGLRQAIKLIEKDTTKKEDETKNLIEKTDFLGGKGRYWGEAAEIHVTAELLYRGFQAANIPVDEGLDILAVKDNNTFYFQVKHKDISNNQAIKITKSSFEKTGRGNVYYVFVLLSNEKRDFLIIPFHIVNDWIREGIAQATEDGYMIYIKVREGKYFIKEKGLDYYLNNWLLIK